MSTGYKVAAFIGFTIALGGITMADVESASWDGNIIQYGKMHEAIGQQKHQGRVSLESLLARPHFFGVAAMENLAGEMTIYDGKATITRVNRDGQLEPFDHPTGDAKATLLVGAYVLDWSERAIEANVSSEDFDSYVGKQAVDAGIDPSKPFVFTVSGEFRDVTLHVINGACPLHARLKKTEIPPENRPFERDLPEVKGTVVGVYARDAVGDITHPATSVHCHLIFKDPISGAMVTGHVEQIGLAAGGILRLPR